MSVEVANTSYDATLVSHSTDTQMIVKPEFSLISIKLAGRHPAWYDMTEEQYRNKLKDPSQKESVDLAFYRVGQALRNSNWFAVQDPNFRSDQQSVVEEAKGDPNTQINFILAGIKGYTRYTQEKFNEIKSSGGDKWKRDVENLTKELKKQKIKVKP
jgi:hypothetical protein